MSWPLPIRVVGVGSPRGDDAVAFEAIRKLRERPGLPPGIEFFMVEGGQRVLELLDARGTLVLVDAVAAGDKPGMIYRFDWPDESIENLRPGSTHDLRPAEALRLAAALGIAPPRVLVFGIEIESLGHAPGLSPSVMAAVPELVRRLAVELEVEHARDVAAARAAEPN
jgi:hydrogenase maturation protease